MILNSKQDWMPENKNLLAKKRARNFLVSFTLMRLVYSYY